jgi:hypothetical protein
MHSIALSCLVSCGLPVTPNGAIDVLYFAVDARKGDTLDAKRAT